MTLLAVEGTYKDGRVELSEPPLGAPAEARVIVTFLPSPAPETTDSAAEDRREAGHRLLESLTKANLSGSAARFDREEIYSEPKTAGPTESDPEPDDAARREAGERLLALFDEGISLGGPPYPTREEIYAERTDRLDDRAG